MTIQAYLRDQKKRVGLVAAGLLIVAVAAWFGTRRSDDPSYLTARVERGDITSVVEATGTINPLTTVPVGSYVSGTVQYVFADFNSRVQAGQVLAQLDPEIYRAQVVQASGNLEVAQANEKNLQASIVSQQAAIRSNQANLDRLKAAADYAHVNAKRIQDLASDGVISRDQADLTRSGLDQADAQYRVGLAQLNQSIADLGKTRAQLDEARAQIKTMRGALDLAEANLRYCTILSPIDGTVVARNVTVGQSVAASLQAPVVFSIAQDLKRMQVYVATDESDTGNIQVGTDATFQVDAFPNKVFHGRVSAIRLNANTVQNVVTYNTIVDFENPDEKLLPGETAYATIPTGHAANVVKVPNAALRFTPSLRGPQLQRLYHQYQIPTAATGSHIGGMRVVWKRSGGQLRPLAVRVGITDYNFTQLIAGDLKPGDVLVTGEELPGNNAGAPPNPSTPRFGMRQ